MNFFLSYIFFFSLSCFFFLSSFFSVMLLPCFFLYPLLSTLTLLPPALPPFLWFKNVGLSEDSHKMELIYNKNNRMMKRDFEMEVKMLALWCEGMKIKTESTCLLFSQEDKEEEQLFFLSQLHPPTQSLLFVLSSRIDQWVEVLFILTPTPCSFTLKEEKRLSKKILRVTSLNLVRSKRIY